VNRNQKRFPTGLPLFFSRQSSLLFMHLKSGNSRQSDEVSAIETLSVSWEKLFEPAF